MGQVAEVLDDREVIEEALDNFAALIDDLDFAVEMDFMGIGRLQFLRRKQMRIELEGLYMALWRLALARSFPRDADMMFDVFLRRYAESHPGKRGAHIVGRALEYWGMLAPAGDADFNGIARHLLSFLESNPNEVRALSLRLALHIRSAYRFIFERLI